MYRIELANFTTDILKYTDLETCQLNLFFIFLSISDALVAVVQLNYVKPIIILQASQ